MSKLRERGTTSLSGRRTTGPISKLARKASAKRSGPDDLVFGTSEGKTQEQGNIRHRILAKAIERANERLAEQGEIPLPEGLTPHSLRRTFASVLYALGEPPTVVMAEMGHTDPGLALRIYAQAIGREEDEKTALRALVMGPEFTGNGSEGADDTAAAGLPVDPLDAETRS